MKPFPLVRFTLGLIGTVLLSGCGDGGGTGGESGAGAAATSGERTAAAAAGAGYTVAVISKGTIHEFWRSIEAGARKAEAELNAAGTKVQVIWKGPLREDDRDQQIQVIENFIS